MVLPLLQTLLLNGMLGLAAYWTSRHGFRQPAGLTRGLAAVILAWSWATLGMEILGPAGWLSLTALGLWTALGLGIGFVLRLRDRVAESIETGEPAGGRVEWEAILALGLFLWAAVLFGVRSLLMAVKVVSDGPIYHLYFAARWWKEGRVSLIATPFGENAATYFPAGGDLWFTWLMTSWGGDRLAKVGQAPFLFVALLAAYALARRLGAGRSSALIAVTWFGCATPMILFSFEPNVDTIFVAGYLLSALFLARYEWGDDRGRTLALAGLAAGGALGTKPTGVVFVPVLLALGAAAVLRRPFPPARKFAHLAILAVSPLILAGCWYARNTVMTGNPLYPLHVTVLGHVLLPGWYDRSVMRYSPYYLRLDDWRALVDIVVGVLDLRQAPLWLAALAVGGLATRGTPSGRGVRAASALALLNMALFWLAIPYRTQTRFMLQALGVAVVPLASLLDRARWLRLAAVAMLALHVLTPNQWPLGGWTTPPWDLSPLVPSAIPAVIAFSTATGPSQRSPTSAEILIPALVIVGIGLVATAVAWLWSRAGERPSVRRVGAAATGSLALVVIATVLTVPLGIDSRRVFYPSFPDYLRGWLALELHAGPSGTRVAYAGTDLPYYLLGAGLRNDVRYINVSGEGAWLLHDYHRAARGRGMPTWPNSRPGWDRIAPDYATWLKNLSDERIQLLVITRANPAEGPHNLADPEGFPIERTWADSHPEVFEPVYGGEHADPMMRIYRVRPATGAEGP